MGHSGLGIIRREHLHHSSSPTAPTPLGEVCYRGAINISKWKKRSYFLLSRSSWHIHSNPRQHGVFACLRIQKSVRTGGCDGVRVSEVWVVMCSDIRVLAGRWRRILFIVIWHTLRLNWFCWWWRWEKRGMKGQRSRRSPSKEAIKDSQPGDFWRI